MFYIHTVTEKKQNYNFDILQYYLLNKEETDSNGNKSDATKRSMEETASDIENLKL